MQAPYRLHLPVVRAMEICLGCANVGVTHEVLDGLKIISLIEEGCCECVPHDMRINSPLNHGLFYHGSDEAVKDKTSGKKQEFWKALKKEDQEVFDQLFEKARLHVENGDNAPRPWPFETVLISMLLEQEKELEGLRSRIRTHKNQEKEACQPEGNRKQGQKEIG